MGRKHVLVPDDYFRALKAKKEAEDKEAKEMAVLGKPQDEFQSMISDRQYSPQKGQIKDAEEAA